ncbi:unnamed protein product, partial [Mesorhabditis spiculigera]
MFRVFVYCSLMYVMTAILAERLHATIFFHDYDQKRYLFISVQTQIVTTVSSMMGSILYTFGGGKAVMYLFMFDFPFTAILAVLSMAGSYSLHKYNMKKLNDILRRFEWNEYSLSLRFQLKENVRALKLIRLNVMIHGIIMLIGLTLFAGPFVFFDAGSPEQELAWVVLEAAQNYYVFVLQVGLLLYVERWRLGLGRFINRWVFQSKKVCPETTVAVPPYSVATVTDLHFGLLERVWEVARRSS